jgi:hypothetical protein
VINQIDITLAAIRLVYTCAAIVGIALSLISYHAAQLDCSRVRLSGRNGFRLMLARSNLREERSHLLAHAIVVLVGVLSLFSPLPATRHGAITGIAIGVGFVGLVVNLAVNSSIAYTVRHAVLLKLDAEELDRLQRLLESDGIAFTDTSEQGERHDHA